jgi:hypothetical protein
MQSPLSLILSRETGKGRNPIVSGECVNLFRPLAFGENPSFWLQLIRPTFCPPFAINTCITPLVEMIIGTSQAEPA